MTINQKLSKKNNISPDKIMKKLEETLKYTGVYNLAEYYVNDQEFNEPEDRKEYSLQLEDIEKKGGLREIKSNELKKTKKLKKA